jgi:hypothetical protein
MRSATVLRQRRLGAEGRCGNLKELLLPKYVEHAELTAIREPAGNFRSYFGTHHGRRKERRFVNHHEPKIVGLQRFQ